MRMSAGAEERLDSVLSRPNSDCVLITDLHLAPQHWVHSLTWKIKQASRSGTTDIAVDFQPISVGVGI